MNIAREMAEKLARGPVDIGDERAVMTALQRYGYSAEQVLAHTTEAIEFARFFRQHSGLGEVA
jgi:hypothetical protein